MLLAAQPVLAATATAPGELSLAISGADTGIVGTLTPVSVTVTNTTTATTTLAGSQIVMLVSGASAQIQGGVQNSTGGACARNGPAEQFCSVPGIAPGASATVTFSVEGLAAGTLTAAAAQAFAGTSAFATISMAIAPAPTDVQVTGFASTGSPKLGSDYTYTFQVKDNGPWVAPGVTFSDAVPSLVTVVEANSTAGTCSFTSGTLSCDLGDIAVGAQQVVTVTVQAPSTAQTYSDTARVTMADTGSRPGTDVKAVT
jgi:uncharacterized repeat protein (TIGR01451 family)